MINIIIDGLKIKSEQKTILDVAKDNNIAIPNFCFDKRLEAYGGCGMCVVEIEGQSKLSRACSTKIFEGQIIDTKSHRVTRARKTALDMYLSDHRGDCLPPCTLGCPANTDIQGYVGLIANNQPIEAVKVIKEAIPIPASIGRICPHPCETDCRRDLIESPVSIASLKFFAADYDLAQEKPYIPAVSPSTGKNVAVIGAGPGGLTIAYFLQTKGHNVTIFEMMEKPGGMLRYGIPEYRLPKAVIDKEVDILKEIGITINYGVKLGEDITIKELQNNYDASFLALGAWKASSMRTAGEHLPGVLGGIDFLREVEIGNPIELGDDVVVVGGGNTAMDVARTAIRLGIKNVTVLYRRTESEMPAQDIEIVEAKEEGVKFEFLVAPTDIIEENGRAVGVNCQRMELGEADSSGRRRPVPIEGSHETYKTTTIIRAIGQSVDLGNIKGLATTKWGTIDADESSFMTNLDGIFAGGDVVTGPKDAIDAVAAGKFGAKVIDSYLQGELIPHKKMRLVERHDMEITDYSEKTALRAENTVMIADKRAKTFEKIVETLSVEDAIYEGNRCLECGCDAVHTCTLLENIKTYEVDTSKEYESEHRRVVIKDHQFIERDADKCVQCSLCIRICSDVIGVEALGLVNRGFEAFVAPEFNQPLSQSSCVSCGACIEVCPTGALREKLTDKKDIPLPYTEYESHCTKCDVACEVTYHLRDNLIYKVTPRNETGIICSEGKFGFEHLNTIFDYNVIGKIANDKVAILVNPVIGHEELDHLKILAKRIDAKIFTTRPEAEKNAEKFSTKIELIDKVINGSKRPINTIGTRTLAPKTDLVNSIDEFKTLITIGVDELEFDFNGLTVAMDDKETAITQKADIFVPLTNIVHLGQTITRGNCELIKVKKIGTLKSMTNVDKIRDLFI